MKLAMLLALCVLGCQTAPLAGDGYDLKQRADIATDLTGCKEITEVANNGPYVWYATGCGKRWVCNWEGKTLCRLSPWQQDECIKKEESK